MMEIPVDLKFNDTNIPISLVEPIERNMESTFDDDEIPLFVESPLIKPIEVIRDKGIEVIECSANRKDIIRGNAFIVINTKSLSEKNYQLCCKKASAIISESNFSRAYSDFTRRRINNLKNERNPFISVFDDGLYRCCSAVVFELPVDENSTVSDVEQKMIEITSFLKNQT